MEKFISGKNPIYQAKKIDEILKHLVDIKNNKDMRNGVDNSRDFALRNFSINKVLGEYIEFIK